MKCRTSIWLGLTVLLIDFCIGLCGRTCLESDSKREPMTLGEELKLMKYVLQPQWIGKFSKINKRDYLVALFGDSPNNCIGDEY